MTPQHLLTEFGHCTTVAKAHLIIASHGGTSHMDKDNGTLVLRYPGQLARRVNPIFDNDAGWLVAMNEIRREVTP